MYIKINLKKNFYNSNNFLWFLFKLLILLILLIVIYGMYLDQKIRSRIDGKVWQLPATVYGRIINLEPGTPISENEMIRLLELTQYRQMSKITHPGEFIVKEKKIEIIRRSFNFPDTKEKQIHALLTFDSNRLYSIKNMDNNCQFNLFRLDPCLITILSSPNSEQRIFLGRKYFPNILVNTLLTIEDRHFYKHDGISFYSICRALLANINAGHTVQGASTLTQQLVKNLFLNSKRSYWRKFNEAYMALIMDARYSKDRILELYMNEVYLGQNGNHAIHGFPLASLYYFNCPIEELSLDQQAMLVGMVKGASIYNPWRNPKLALERRNFVLNILKKQRVINQNIYNVLINRKLGVRSFNRINSSQPAFIQLVKKELQNKLGYGIRNLSGIKIFTTFDSIAQNAAEKAVIEGIPILKKQNNLKDLEAAIVIVDRYNGEIRAIVGGSDPQYAGYNRATQARRSIGSLAKPTTYLAALSQPNKYRLNTWISDMPIYLHQTNGKIWSPQNENHHFSNRVMLVDALAHSMNVPTVNLGMNLGLPTIINTWQKMGISKNQLYPVPAIILGALNLTPIEVAQAFQTIASGGNYATLSTLCSIISEDGAILYQKHPNIKRVFPAQAVYMTLRIMQKVVEYGTGHELGTKYIGLNLAGKTGTTNNGIDTWFAGIDGRELVITWVGRDNNKPTKLYGSSGAMIIYQRYLSNQYPVPLDLVPPEDIFDIDIDETGNFVCNNGIRKIPVWTSNPDILCQQNYFNSSTNNLNELPQIQQYRKNDNKKKNENESLINKIKNMLR